MPLSWNSTPRPVLHISYVYIMFIIFALPTFSLFTIAFLGYYLHFEETTATHCKVPNMIPSISAVVGGVTPERYIWRVGIALFSFPRLFDGLLYYNFLSQGLSDWCPLHWANRLLLALHWIQYLSLLGLSFVSSRENYIVHRNCFIGFIVCSILHMLLFLVIFKIARDPPSYRDKISFRLRVAFSVCHVLLFLTSLYLYWRHNTYCEPYMYSWYGLCEYLVVVTNIAFHTTEAVDFQNDYYISVAPPSRLKRN